MKIKRLEIRLEKKDFDMVNEIRSKLHVNISSLVRELILKYYKENVCENKRKGFVGE
jgi:hypothetical protein